MGGGTHEHAAGIRILGVAGVLALQFKSGKSEYGIYISYRSWHADLCIFCLERSVCSKNVLNEVSNVVGLNSDYFKTLWKSLGVTYAAEF